MMKSKLKWLLPGMLFFSACGADDQATAAIQLPTASVGIELTEVVDDLSQPTDIQFAPGKETIAVILEQGGQARWVELPGGTPKPFFEVDARSGGELGLLGLAFHPEFETNGKFYVNYTAPGGDAALSRVEEWRLPNADFASGSPTRSRQILEVNQPFSNHNAGQLAFGPDGFLYVGYGDGGSSGDPMGNAQNPGTRLGKLLRIDIDRPQDGLPYGIPGDNPFIGRAGFLPEIWALGFRNPWRYSFSRAGRLVLADVGQNRWEEIDIVERGGNYGWDRLEGRHCYPSGTSCSTAGLVPPIYEYGRDQGVSVTGGYTYEGAAIPSLKGKYVFGDLNGGMWAITLPQEATGQVTEVTSLGNQNLTISTFGRDNTGELYVADHTGGAIFRLDAAK